MGTAFTELRDEIKKSKIFGSYEAFAVGICHQKHGQQ